MRSLYCALLEAVSGISLSLEIDQIACFIAWTIPSERDLDRPWSSGDRIVDLDLELLSRDSAIGLMGSNRRSSSYVVLVYSRSSSEALNCCHAKAQREFRGIYRDSFVCLVEV